MEHDFKDMYNNVLDSDIKIVYGDEPITLYAHKIILRRGSGLLAKIMDGGMCETASGVISLTEHDPWAVQTVIRYMYGVYDTAEHGNMQLDLDLSGWRKLLYLAHYLLVPSQLMKIIIAKRPCPSPEKFHKYVKIAYIIDLEKIWNVVCDVAIAWDGDKLGKLPHEVFMQFHNKRLLKRGLDSEVTLRMMLEYTARNPDFNILHTMKDYQFNQLNFGMLSSLSSSSAVTKYPFMQSMIRSMLILRSQVPESDDESSSSSESEDD